jgi:hypothetical protein
MINDKTLEELKLLTEVFPKDDHKIKLMLSILKRQQKLNHSKNKRIMGSTLLYVMSDFKYN